jgi:hypothetical protein
MTGGSWNAWKPHDSIVHAYKRRVHQLPAGKATALAAAVKPVLAAAAQQHLGGVWTPRCKSNIETSHFRFITCTGRANGMALPNAREFCGQETIALSRHEHPEVGHLQAKLPSKHPILI